MGGYGKYGVMIRIRRDIGCIDDQFAKNVRVGEKVRSSLGLRYRTEAAV